MLTGTPLFGPEGARHWREQEQRLLSRPARPAAMRLQWCVLGMTLPAVAVLVAAIARALP